MWERPKLDGGIYRFQDALGTSYFIDGACKHLSISSNEGPIIHFTPEMCDWLARIAADYAATGKLRDLPEASKPTIYHGVFNHESDYISVPTKKEGEYEIYKVPTGIGAKLCAHLNAIIQSKAAPVELHSFPEHEPAPEVVPGMWRIEKGIVFNANGLAFIAAMAIPARR